MIAIASAALADNLDDIIEANANHYDNYAPQYLPNEIIVRFKAGIPQEEIERFNAQNGVVEILNTPHFTRLRLPDGASVQEFVRKYEESVKRAMEKALGYRSVYAILQSLFNEKDEREMRLWEKYKD